MNPVHLSNLWMFLTSPALQLAIVVGLYRRKWARLYPAFFVLLCFRLVRAAIFVPLAAWYTQHQTILIYQIYFYSYWYLEAIDALLVLAILYRVFDRCFSSYPVLSRWTFVLFMLALAVCLVLAIFTAPETIRSRGVISIVYPIFQSTVLLRAGLLAFLFLFVFGIGIRLRDYLFGIAAGFGLEAFIILTIGVMKPQLKWLSYLNTGADLIATVIWFVYLFLPRKEAVFSGDLSQGHHEIAGWKEALSELLHR